MFQKKIMCVLIILSFLLSSCSLFGDSIKMPKDDYYYENYSGTLEELVDEFKDLGFKNIKTIPCGYSGYTTKIIKNIEIDDDWLGFNKGDKYFSSSIVEIEYYAFCENLTINNSDVHNILTNKSIYYLDFLEEYDGKYIEFDGCVQEAITYNGMAPIIEVSGGDYDPNGYGGLLIRVDVNNLASSPENSVNKNVKTGKNVKVIGKINAWRGEYFKLIYIDAVYLQYR